MTAYRGSTLVLLNSRRATGKLGGSRSVLEFPRRGPQARACRRERLASRLDRNVSLRLGTRDAAARISKRLMRTTP